MSWLKRLDLLKSLDLTSLAAELNQRRGADTHPKILRRDQLANPNRMKRALLAIHQIVGNDRSWIVTMERIAAEIQVSERTARRALLDLEDACLVEITRRERARRRGGQGPSEYRLVWPNVDDIAHTQGFQPSLFSEETEAAEDSAAEATVAEDDQPDGLSGLPHTARGRAPGHSGRAPGHSGRAPGHSDRALRGAHAPVSLSSLPFNSPPPPNRGEGGEEVKIWQELQERITAYGVANPEQAIVRARRRGWTDTQVRTLIGYCEDRTIAGIPAYGPGALFWHLAEGTPGQMPTVKPSEAYRRAQRERDRRRELERQAEKEKPRHDPPHPLEAEWGHVLDRLSPGELIEVIKAAEMDASVRNNAVRWIAGRKPGTKVAFLRGRLLESLATLNTTKGETDP